MLRQADILGDVTPREQRLPGLGADLAGRRLLSLTYLVLAIGRAPYLRIDRPGAAIVGATLMIATGIISLEEAYRHIDFRMLLLLFGMMVLIAHLRMARFFRTAVRWGGAHVHEPTLLLIAVVF